MRKERPRLIKMAYLLLLVVLPLKAELADFKNDNERFSYAMGIEHGKQLSENVSEALSQQHAQKIIFELNRDRILHGINDGLSLSDVRLAEKIGLEHDAIESLIEASATPQDALLAHRDAVSYTTGLMTLKITRSMIKPMVKSLSRYGIDFYFDWQLYSAGVGDRMANKRLLSDIEAQQVINSFLMNMDEKKALIAKRMSIEEHLKGDRFRQAFEKRPGVVKTASGLLYKIEKEGEGKPVKKTDFVILHYTGRLVDGGEFESSYNNPERAPGIFKLNDGEQHGKEGVLKKEGLAEANNVIKGWSEGIPLIKKGGRITLVVPPELAYGEDMQDAIPPGSTLIFDIELVDANLTFEK